MDAAKSFASRNDTNVALEDGNKDLEPPDFLSLLYIYIEIKT